ncbi:PolC-type DNA polymerase III [Pseudothermotoga lettingae]|uniref:DNA polymerase III PolC-type n=1 Tax=Pseudothermotoga lettingae (strain ATCC BAA-301 / DSM 14385 / NBRC 107922 / TMO) TaxID=416591 RepID=A8F3S5_PSELT|nr:PolC-type DNA polymerase III [Pseudothermotoga lettingae]ABV32809.1 DNA polymerase III, alpha subunit [Pseudothermotoga lettingae TMO]KUK21518.1 MAG: DNA polymerase III polC-type [Pseudothermotoga lettingae]GLI48195.1 DNA polymerase III PolC-type [Pseudothermotoga lettingae TMO]
MKAVSVEHVQINLKDFLSKLGIDFKEDCKIESVFFDSVSNELLIKTDRCVKNTNELRKLLESFFEVPVSFYPVEAFKEISIDVDALRRELNGSFPYVQSAAVEGEKVVLKVSGEFGRDRIKSKMNQVKDLISKQLGKDLEIHVQVVESQAIVEKHDLIVEEVQDQKKKSRNRKRYQKSDYLTPSNLPSNSDDVKVAGEIYKMDLRDGRKRFLLVHITDKKDSLTCLAFNSIINDILSSLQKGDWAVFEGLLKYDESGEPTLHVKNFKKIEPNNRNDLAEKKRVELHAHSKFSDLDSVLDIDEYVNRASSWGWKSIALTDHGVVQGIPYFYEACRKKDIKPIFGVEAYVVNDSEPVVIGMDKDIEIDQERYVIVDIETTGLHPMFSEIIEIGAVAIENGQITDEFHSFVKPSEKLNAFTVQFTKITDQMLANQPSIEEVLPKFMEFCKDTTLVAHNANFDYRFLRYWIEKSLKLNWEPAVIDTLALAKKLVRLSSYNLEKLASHFKLGPFSHHRASEDAKVTAKIFLELLKLLKERKITTFKEIESLQKESTLRQSKPFHTTIIVQTKEGLKNLYKLISNAHVKYFYSVPRIPKSELQALRAGLLIGSACVGGELIQEMLTGANESEIEEKMAFYDFVEVMPLDLLPVTNDLGLTRERLKELYIKLYEIARKINVPVVMTGDVHFLDPEDEKIRKVLQAPQQENISEQPAAYLRTTDEMLKAALEIFEDTNKAYKVVVEFPNQIAESVEKIVPLEKKLHTPRIEGAEDQVRTIAMQRAEQLYGTPLPELVERRLNRELDAIINHGYAVLYLIAKKMVDKSLNDGYVVGSRGSVGSSFIAYLMGITEVNPLPPHYFCSKCRYVEFIESNEYGSGYDLPVKICPSCGEPLNRNGQDIPFETFMGFEGDKVPDIDLNFSGDYQDEAHRFIETLFGKQHVYRAGTINTIASRTAFGFVRAYEEKSGRKVRKSEAERLANAITGVKRTTGQHPGGLMIIPKEYEVYDFTPIQHPANTKEAMVLTTHFDYESIHDDLVKIDALGHDDPTFIKILKDMTNIDPMKIPMDDEKTLKLFSSVEHLGIKPEELGTDVGTLGIPEFGTQFVRGMLSETRPKSFAELVRISGLSHGTDVWLNNAQEWIRQKHATLSDVIACRDDIMNYLIKKGMNASKAFKIMENVRKGKGLSREDEEELKKLKIPEWYIESCKRIKYLFPKAHATAYVSMAFRIAYFKVHHPLAFYAAYFTLKGDEFDLEAAMHGPEIVKKKLEELSGINDKDVRERAKETTLEVMLEMFLRGFSFLPVNVNKSHARLFLIEENKLRIPFNKLPNLGDNVAESIIAARREKPFTSLEDIVRRTKMNKSHIESFKKLVELEGLPEKEQISLF